MKLMIVAILVIVVSYIGSCSFIDIKRTGAFSRINIGDTEEKVISEIGIPSFRENGNTLFSKYASKKCLDCTERLWFENKLSLDIKAWSVEIDNHKKVIKKDAWVSP